MIQAEIICDSINPQNIRLTTFQLRYPKFIHGEFMTHRRFSRNASSSRAIPTKKLLEEVRTDALRAGPEFWGKNQAGMQAAEELDEHTKTMAISNWRIAAQNAADVAEEMLNLGVHKQIANRILEPFSHINVVVSATEYMNFFGLRLDKAAQPEIRVLAEKMWLLYNHNEPRKLRPGQWHLPYIIFDRDGDLTKEVEAELIKVSVARCARVSYLSFETGKKTTIEEDLKLYDRLLGAQPLHASPAEHQATPDEVLSTKETGWDPGFPIYLNSKEHGNFEGWRQYRKMLKDEDMAPLPEHIKQKEVA